MRLGGLRPTTVAERHAGEKLLSRPRRLAAGRSAFQLAGGLHGLLEQNAMRNPVQPNLFRFEIVQTQCP